MKSTYGYRRKFAQFIELCRRTKPGDVVVVTSPTVLGDDYAELVTNLNRLADAQALLSIVPRRFRDEAQERNGSAAAGSSTPQSAPG